MRTLDIAAFDGTPTYPRIARNHSPPAPDTPESAARGEEVETCVFGSAWAERHKPDYNRALLITEHIAADLRARLRSP